ncbi:hypothetical protein EPUS_06128 [Endocarpon pusillum Z07020]|uniref:Carboxyphosphonoenolpyruvate phosphonomutase n=1 Tax=Endocarpon pusillum (strain Z07020 / HMAS-L-300199) TaxID=1263415 RepID=U1GWJ7_ENDPU|nr:uncharacterized protein EPUS_06128 [Endocarpon pusillum Z07020]ERF76466.1 hypothetical protein EPUS_06128 [Endocarpon pusillum Z07020]
MSEKRNHNKQSMQKEDLEKCPATTAPGSEPASEALKPGQAKLREWLADTQKVIVCPGIYDGLTARVALAQGFKCLHLRSAAVRFARSGLPDSGESSLEFVMDLIQTVQKIDRDVPLIGEADESLDVEAVKVHLARYHHAGVAAMQLEDSISGQCSKKYRKGNAIDEDTFLERLQAAADERLRISSNIVIIARTNILLSCTCQVCWERALTRLERAIRKGADVVYMAGRMPLQDVEYLARQAFKGVPLMSTPQQAAKHKVKSLGVKIISCPELFTGAIHDCAAHLVQGFGKGSPVPEIFHLDDPTKLGGLRALCGL